MLASFRPLPIVAAVAVALGLSSCAPEYPTQAPLSIQRAGESLLIASCHPATVFEVLVDERSAGLMAETVPRVTEDGLGLQVAGGEPLDLSRIAPDARFDFEPGGSISITL